MVLLDTSESSIFKAVDYLKSGKLVVFPTDTVYGLGASMLSDAAIQNIFKIKQRPLQKPLALLCSNVKQIEQIAIEIPDIFYTLAKQYFPGPLTIILKKHPSVSDLITAHLNTVGVRIPNHRVALKLIETLDCPIVATSANLAGKTSPIIAQAAVDQLNGKIDILINGGKCPLGQTSTVLNVLTSPPIILRAGVLSVGFN